MQRRFTCVLFFLFLGAAFAQEAQHDTSDLAKQTQNPVSNIISVPFQFNFNTGGGLQDKTFFNLNFQPVIPFGVSPKWNLIARTIVPVVSVPVGNEQFSGIGDIQEQLFFTPAKPGSIILGVGPAFSFPTATADPVRTGSWAAGPNVVVVKTTGPFVLGSLVNNLWTFSDNGNNTEVNTFLLQPFFNFNFGKGWALATGPGITANWDAPDGEKWTVPIGMGISRTTVFAGRPMTLNFSYYHNVEHPASSAANQIRFQITLIYPGAH